MILGSCAQLSTSVYLYPSDNRDLWYLSCTEYNQSLYIAQNPGKILSAREHDIFLAQNGDFLTRSDQHYHNEAFRPMRLNVR